MRRFALIGCAALLSAANQSAPADRQQFEVASVKPCKDGDAGNAGSGGGGRGGGNSSVGILDINCQPVKILIQMAYVDYVNGQFQSYSSVGSRVEGEPGWVATERYRINAKAAGPATEAAMRGPMLRALLEDRFKVKAHRETREVPVYALVAAKSGFKMQATPVGGCDARDPNQVQPPRGPGETPWCGTLRAEISLTSSGRTYEGSGLTLAELSQRLSNWAGRPVIDKTGIAGIFDFHLQFATNDAIPVDEPAAPSLSTALGDTGLKLEPSKGLVEFLVIDRVERPSEN